MKQIANETNNYAGFLNQFEVHVFYNQTMPTKIDYKPRPYRLKSEKENMFREK